MNEKYYNRFIVDLHARNNEKDTVIYSADDYDKAAEYLTDNGLYPTYVIYYVESDGTILITD